MRIGWVTIIWLCLCGVPFGLDAAEPPSDVAPVVDAETLAILNEPLPEDEYVNGRTCLDPRMVDRTEILDNSNLLFVGRRGRIWLNQLRGPCFGMEPGDILATESNSSRLCRLDSFKSMDRMPSRGDYNGLCFLGEFEPISEIQADMIRESLAQRRKTRVRLPKGDNQDG